MIDGLQNKDNHVQFSNVLLEKTNDLKYPTKIQIFQYCAKKIAMVAWIHRPQNRLSDNFCFVSPRHIKDIKLFFQIGKHPLRNNNEGINFSTNLKIKLFGSLSYSMRFR